MIIMRNLTFYKGLFRLHKSTETCIRKPEWRHVSGGTKNKTKQKTSGLKLTRTKGTGDGISSTVTDWLMFNIRIWGGGGCWSVNKLQICLSIYSHKTKNSE